MGGVRRGEKSITHSIKPVHQAGLAAVGGKQVRRCRVSSSATTTPDGACTASPVPLQPQVVLPGARQLVRNHPLPPQRKQVIGGSGLCLQSSNKDARNIDSARRYRTPAWLTPTNCRAYTSQRPAAGNHAPVCQLPTPPHPHKLPPTPT